MRLRFVTAALVVSAGGPLLAGCTPRGEPSEAQMKGAVEYYIEHDLGGVSTENNGLRAKIAEFKKGGCAKPDDNAANEWVDCKFTVKIEAPDPATAAMLNLLAGGHFYKDKGKWAVRAHF
jgi:hypothetical protein